MKIISWNVNGLRAILKKNFYEFIQHEDPDVLCLQETKVNQDSLPDIGLPQYGHKEFSCADRRGYSGTAIFSKVLLKNIITYAPLEQELKMHEGRVITADLGEFYLVNVYTPNAQPDLARLPLRMEDWDPRFCDYLQDLQKTKPILSCGDFNVAHKPIDLARPEANRGHAGFTDGEREGFDRHIQSGLVDVFRQLHPQLENAYSWWSYRMNARPRNVGWRIDYFLASKSLTNRVRKCEILKNITGSDHAPVFLEIA